MSFEKDEVTPDILSVTLKKAGLPNDKIQPQFIQTLKKVQVKSISETAITNLLLTNSSRISKDNFRKILESLAEKLSKKIRKYYCKIKIILI